MAWNDNKVHSGVAAGEFAGKNLDFFTLTCVTAEANLGTAAVLEKVVEIISLNGQPVILGTVTTSSGNKILKFAVEHTGAWTTAALETALETHGVGFADFANATVTKADTL